GVGKTTLLHIAAGLEAPDAGNVAIARGTRIGFLDQEVLGAAEGTVAEHARGAATHLREIEAELRALEPELATGDAGVLERYADTQHRFEHAGGYDFDATVGRVLGGLGLAELSDRDVRTLSGVERTRLGLARLLLDDPDLLLLDEPTNHLDVAALEWLERFLLERGEDVPGRIARPLVPRSRHHADAVVRARERRRVPRRLLRVRAPARGARGGHGEGGVAPGRRDRPHGGIHPPLRRGPALEGGARPREEARARRAHRGARDGSAPWLAARGRPPRRRYGRECDAAGGRVRPPDRAHRLAPDRARRADRGGRSERCGEDDARPDDRRRPPGPGGLRQL